MECTNSIRLMFSVADLQNIEDEEDEAEAEDGEPTEPPHTELRVSLSMSKVRRLRRTKRKTSDTNSCFVLIRSRRTPAR